MVAAPGVALSVLWVGDGNVCCETGCLLEKNVFLSGGVDEWPGLLIREGISQAGASGVAAVLVQLGLLGSAPPAPTSSADPHAKPRSLPRFAGGEKVLYTPLLPCHSDRRAALE